MKSTVIASQVIDFFAFLYKISNIHEIEQENYIREKLANDDVEKWIKEISESLGQQDKNELDLFLHTESHIVTLMFPAIHEQQALDNIPKAIEVIKNLTPEKFRKLLEPNATNSETALENLNNLNIPDPEKWKLVYCYQFPEDTIKRMAQFLSKMYKEIYQSYEEKLLDHNSKYREEMNKNKEHFLLMLQDYELMDAQTEIILAPSYSLNIGLMYMSLGENLFLGVVGVKRESVMNNQRQEQELLEILKIMTDERRFQIMRLLKKRPHYGFELAQELGVSNSTITHHISILLSHQLVESRRDENRVYYSTNTEEMKTVLAQLETLFS
ncbi:ArsR/SmtB family transcription factor [Halalkalibacillus halophilus]|uniref:ArsR/SmtB family transcription factor n=1 Tax=Halalkalibacillus halophilus TaxID=392827 RepID=UPI000403C7C7|nr:metalloregulator ArsR/SmtB family transcription factor [Halalkalibacillus halophilus]